MGQCLSLGISLEGFIHITTNYLLVCTKMFFVSFLQVLTS